MNKLSPYGVCVRDFDFDDTRGYNWEDKNYAVLVDKRDELQQKYWQARDYYAMKYDDAINGTPVPDLDEYEQQAHDAKQELEEFLNEWGDEL